MALTQSQSSILKLALFICATDGLISDTEEAKVVELFRNHFTNIDQVEISSEIDAFYSSSDQLETYAQVIVDDDERLIAIDISMKAASSDGLDFRENIALKRLINLWDLKFDEVQYGS